MTMTTTKRSKNPSVLSVINFYNRYKNSKKTRTAKEWQAILADKYDVHYASAVNVYGMFKRYGLTHLFKGRGGYQRGGSDRKVSVSTKTYAAAKVLANYHNVSVREVIETTLIEAYDALTPDQVKQGMTGSIQRVLSKAA